jgi:hypothetical protein
MQRSKRILGMTIAQLVILSCLGCSILGVLGAGLWLVSSGMGMTSLVPPTAAPVLAATPVPTWTLTPAPTFPPTATLIPYEASIPTDWKQYKNENVEIWLPTTFSVVKNPEAYNQEVVDLYRKLGLEDAAKELEANPIQFDLLFRYRPDTVNLYTPSVVVNQYERKGGTIDQFMEESNANLPVNVTVIENRAFSFHGVEGRRAITQSNFNNLSLGSAFYVLQAGDIIWEISCNAHLNDFYNLQAIFDDIARTFRVAGQP